MKVAISLKRVTVRREHTTILHEVTATVAEGAVVGLLGPSGAGKTTLMQAVMGLERPAAGSVRVLGLPAGSAALRSQLGYVTQAPAVYADLSVAENLHYFGVMVGADGARVREVVSEVRLDAQADQLVGSLSGGQRARVSLAVALLGRPRVLVLDEPTVGLDPVLRAELWTQFHELARSGVSLLVSSHVMDEAGRCDSLLLLRDGRLLAAGTPAELMTRTHTRDVETAFLRLVEEPE